MTKHLIFIFAAFCSLQAHANVCPAQGDTVRYTSLHAATELLLPMQPVYLDGVVLPVWGSGNWFVSIAGGTAVFLGTPLGCEDLFGRLRPSYSLTVGKWFTPSVGARISYSGLQFKDGVLSTQDYHHVHADLLWNVLGRRYARQEQVRWSLAPFAGIGLLHHATNGHNPFAFSYGVQGQYRISRWVSTILEFSGMTTFQDFDGYGKANRLGDHMLSLSAGFIFHIGKTGWKRAIDVTPYIRQNEWLTDYANFLSKENERYKGDLDRDRRTFAELRKILKIEGLLDTYSHLFENDDYVGRKLPVNSYSGLNSLRARLKNRRWDGKSAFETQGVDGNARADSLSGIRDGVHGLVTASDTDAVLSDTVSTEYTALMQSGSECIGSPVYFFFSLNTARLTDVSQMLNLDELARVAKKYGLAVKVTGAADSSTGTSAINDSLSISRAGFITVELKRRGIPEGMIVKSGRGGIADYLPTEANRHTKVELFFPEPARISE